jgi:CRISPR-associated protein Cmr3
MKTEYLRITATDPLISRDGRPFGAGQGNRMRGLTWFLPSVVAGSFRTNFVKACPELDFSGDTPQKLLTEISVAGVLPACDNQLYFPAPLDCAWHKETKAILRSTPQKIDEGCGTDFPDNLWPVLLTAEQAADDFKAETPPAWWPLEKYIEWLTKPEITYSPNWFTKEFLGTATTTVRDHVELNPDFGAAQESRIFASANLHVSHLPRYQDNKSKEEAKTKSDLGNNNKTRGQKVRWFDRFAEIHLSARVSFAEHSQFAMPQPFDTWHPLGGERRLAHWQSHQPIQGWQCPEVIKKALAQTERVRLTLATPAIFTQGWKPDLQNGPLKNKGLELVAACIGRWRAVSGWSLAEPKGPKAIRRIVPAGSVFYFTCAPGAATALADLWLQPLSDEEKEQRDGFGLALWGTW